MQTSEQPAPQLLGHRPVDTTDSRSGERLQPWSRLAWSTASHAAERESGRASGMPRTPVDFLVFGVYTSQDRDVVRTGAAIFCRDTPAYVAATLTG